MTVQNHSVLLFEGPADLLERPIAEYSSFLRTPARLGREHLEAIDYALRHHVVRLLVRAAGEEELVTAYEGLRRLVPVQREQELDAWVPRWRGFADLLESRLAVLAAQEPETALRFAHAEEILALVAQEPGLTQIEIGERLELKPANLSRILGVLEAHELIERRVIGREKRVHPGRLAPSAAAEVTTTPKSNQAYPPLAPRAETLSEPKGSAYGESKLPKPYDNVLPFRSAFYQEIQPLPHAATGGH